MGSIYYNFTHLVILLQHRVDFIQLMIEAEASGVPLRLSDLTATLDDEDGSRSPRRRTSHDEVNGVESVSHTKTESTATTQGTGQRTLSIEVLPTIPDQSLIE